MLQEAGKTITDSLMEVDSKIQTFIAAAEEAKQIVGKGLSIQAALGNEKKMAFTISISIGVVCALKPFDFPFNLTTHKSAPASSISG